MTRDYTVLHVAAHLGGGVGRALLAVARAHRARGRQIRHIFACHEVPTNSQFVDQLRDDGFEVHAPANARVLNRLVAAADLVQVDWWHHPRQCAWLVGTRTPMRTVVWAHTSGLHVPAIPPAFVRSVDAFLLTAPASTAGRGCDSAECIPSAGGFDDFPIVRRRRPQRDGLRYGYLGSLSPAKLHPSFVDFIRAVDVPGFAVDCYGDLSGVLEFQQAAARHASLFRLHGYAHTPASVLRDLDVFIYLLNPEHYGTTENALLEAMASGVVPIVMDNPVESAIVRHRETGWIINSPDELRQVVRRLNGQPDERRKMARAASSFVRRTYAPERTADALARCYERLLGRPKRRYELANVFGNTPAEWLLTGLGDYRSLIENGLHRSAASARLQHSFLYAKTKSSPFHFHRCFPGDPQIRAWTRGLESDLAVAAAA